MTYRILTLMQFTHQIFDGEFIPGWRPLQSAEAESKDIYAKWKSDGNSRVLHSSYENITNNSAAGMLWTAVTQMAFVSL